ncbi:MAG: GNAT family N-acetyltransferase [Erysipelotrichaceae bacterium]|nr:GNAT family N-acetyltransferase [Erysipelotrichaceae bacterium]
MIEVRKITDQDLEDIRLINQLNSSNPNKPQNEKEFCLYFYVEYYAKFEKENSFIAIDTDKNETVGYILASKDYRQYISNIENDFKERASELGFEERFFLETHCFELYGKDYPAHFHIDVKPGYQHEGIGTILLKTEIKHMKDNGVKGLMLIVGKNKESGNKFYEKNGFKVIDSNDLCYVRGIRL